MAVYTFDESIVSDLHKDAYGFRPREFFWSQWEAFNDDEKQMEWDRLYDALTMSIEQDKICEANALAAFEVRVAEVIAVGAKDEETALRWMTMGEQFEHSQSVESWVWEQGILHTDRGRELVKTLNTIWEVPY